MDLKKEIKLSDLLPGRKKKDTAAEEPKAEKPKKERKPLFGRKPKAEQPPKEERRKADKAPKAKRHASVGRKKKLVGLKVGASQIAAAQVVNNGGAGHTGRTRGPRARRRRRRRARDPDTLAAALRTFFKKNKLSRQNVRLGISNNRIGVRMFEIGGIEDTKQLANAIRFRAQEVLPIPLEEAVLDYHILGEYTDGEGHTKHRVLLVVAYRDLVERYTAACKKAGSASPASTSRRSRSCGRSRRSRRPGGRELRPRGRERRPRPDDLRGLRRQGLSVHARPRLGRRVAQRRHRPVPRPGPVRGRADQALAVARRAVDSRWATSEQAEKVREAVVQQLTPSPASSSPRSSSTSRSPALWASARSS